MSGKNNGVMPAGILAPSVKDKPRWMSSCNPAEKEKLRQKLAEETATYLRAGGMIKKQEKTE